MERFTAILIENYKGAFPTWLAPHQVTLIPVSNENTWTTLGKWLRNSRDRGVRADVDERNEKNAVQDPCFTNKQDSLPIDRWRQGNGRRNSQRSSLWTKETQTVSVDDFVQAILADIANKSRVEK